MREAAILKQLNHENIIKLQDVFLTDERCYFLLEYMDEDLKRYLDRNRPLDRRIIRVKDRMKFLFVYYLSSRVLCINY
jgi:serine/threonine protein kinase